MRVLRLRDNKNAPNGARSYFVKYSPLAAFYSPPPEMNPVPLRISAPLAQRIEYGCTSMEEVIGC